MGNDPVSKRVTAFGVDDGAWPMLERGPYVGTFRMLSDVNGSDVRVSNLKITMQRSPCRMYDVRKQRNENERKRKRNVNNNNVNE